MRIPKALTNQKLPDAVVYKLEKLLKQFVRESGRTHDKKQQNVPQAVLY